MAKSTADDAPAPTNENQKIRAAQRRMNRMVRILKRKAKMQKRILTGRISRLVPVTSLKRLVRKSMEPYASVHGKTPQISSKTPNVIATILIDKTMNDLNKVALYCIQSGRTLVTKDDVDFVLEHKCNPKRIEFKSLVAP